MTVLHSGSTKKFSTNWEAAFGKRKRGDGSATVPSAAAKKSKPAKKAKPAASAKLKATAKASAKKVAKKPSTKISRAEQARAEAELWEKALNKPADLKRAKKEKAAAAKEAKKPLTTQIVDAAKDAVELLEEEIGVKKPTKKKAKR